MMKITGLFFLVVFLIVGTSNTFAGRGRCYYQLAEDRKTCLVFCDLAYQPGSENTCGEEWYICHGVAKADPKKCESPMGWRTECKDEGIGPDTTCNDEFGFPIHFADIVCSTGCS